MFGLSKPLAYGLVALALLVLAASGAAWAAHSIRSAIADAAATARAEQDAKWRAEIEAANAAVARAQAEQARVAAAADAQIRDAQERLDAELRESEARNAALPNARGCGVGIDRVRLLNRSR